MQEACQCASTNWEEVLLPMLLALLSMVWGTKVVMQLL